MSTSPRLEILEYCETELGVLCLRRRELLSSPGTIVTEVILDQEFLMSSYNTESENALATAALEWHGGRELDVLVGGLGLGYTAHAALAFPEVATVKVLELLPQVIDWVSRDLVPLASLLRAEPRLQLKQGDVFEHLANPPEKLHDAILIDVDHSPDELLDPRNQSFYTAAGLTRAGEHLAENGVLAIWSSSPSEVFESALAQVFSEVKLETIHWRNDLIDQDQRNDLFLARR
ncbi:MAG: hypothetical protein MK179_02055 [Pirellulaceae bacterium]|nr:hypothetical protein [Pirellulaceae bacterium]